MLVAPLQKTSAAKRMSRTGPLSSILIAWICLLPNLVLAMPLTPSGFNPDNGNSYFALGGSVVAVELLDSLDPNSEFGFFYQDDPSILVPLFDGLDGCCGQAAEADFLAGEIFDLDTPGDPVNPFPVLPGNIGFYLTIGGALTLYSDPLLNTALGGTDLFYAFESQVNANQWALYFQADLNADGPPLDDIALSILYPLTAVPLPSAVWLVGGFLPAAWLVSRRRKQLAPVTAAR